jgi:chorismate mutase
MAPKISCFGFVLIIGLTASGNVLAQQGGNVGPVEPVKPTGPAAKKAADLIAGYKARIEKEIEQGRKEVERLRVELHELIDTRYAMAESIAELRGELATMGTYSSDPVVNVPSAPKLVPTPQPGAMVHRDFVYGLGSALPKEPTPQEREQLRRLMPRTDLKRMTERLRAEVEETRSEVDQLAFKLLELSAGVPASFQGMGGMGGMNGGQWFGSIGMMRMGGMR